MTRAQRMRLISEIEKTTGSRLITIFLGDRRGLETKIAADILPFCSEHLAKIDGAKKISLYLYSTGGITIAGYAIANLLREYCDSYDVIVPFKALSCATLISLGADSIVMTKMGQLSPIDPSITSPLAPAVQGVAPGGMPVRQVVPVNAS
ncbi:MAG: ATP-dependent Clp protease proteolytic subunit, partial [Chloroflexi bacterium]|nr:ATP-dependent Clp protease proteolytic subunit [Chloroflexota bacterium]